MKKILFGAILLSLITVSSPAHAAPVGRLNQTITAGVLSTDVVDSSRAPVTTPSFAMSSASASVECQTITGVYGSPMQRVAIDNPAGANSGWSLTIAASSGTNAKWTNGTHQYSYNNPAGSGCTEGQLSLDPSAATLGLYGVSSNTGITKGNAASFAANTTNAITLLSASAGSDDIWSGYMTGIGVSQKIPAGQPAGLYWLDLTQTVTAN